MHGGTWPKGSTERNIRVTICPKKGKQNNILEERKFGAFTMFNKGKKQNELYKALTEVTATTAARTSDIVKNRRHSIKFKKTCSCWDKISRAYGSLGRQCLFMLLIA